MTSIPVAQPASTAALATPRHAACLPHDPAGATIPFSRLLPGRQQALPWRTDQASTG